MGNPIIWKNFSICPFPIYKIKEENSFKAHIVEDSQLNIYTYLWANLFTENKDDN